MVFVAVCLAAIQLLPAVEVARLSTRNAIRLPSTLLSDVMLSLFGVAGPASRGVPPPLGWEGRSGLGVLWITAALLAPFLVRSGRVRYQAVICLAMVAFSLGGGIALGALPGFRMFRLPSRMFLIAALPIALLVGQTTQALFNSPEPSSLNPGRRRFTLLEVLTAALASHVSLAAIFLSGWREYHIVAYWASLLFTIPPAYWLLGAAPVPGITAFRWTADRLRFCWAAVLFVDLWSMAWPLVATRQEQDIYAPSACVKYIAAHNQGHGRILDRDVPEADWTTPLPAGLAINLHLETVRGYNPLDILRYKEFVLLISGVDRLTQPSYGIGNLPIENKSLLDLLGVRYLLQPSDLRLATGKDGPAVDQGWREVFEDPSPSAYIFSGGGIRDLPAYTIYENLSAFPRAFIVPQARPLPGRSGILPAFAANDFRRAVFLEGIGPGPETPAGGFRPAAIGEYLPNRVVVGVSGESPGYLVLMDPWFPGWSCTVDGRPAKLYRANYAFRAVAVPAGAHEVVFTFAPASYALGRLISGGSLALIAVVLPLVAVAGRRWPRKGRS
jgi:hypothetical protein